MSYDLWLIPAEHCIDATAARDFALTQDNADRPRTAAATTLADAITAVNAPLSEEESFLSISPLDATDAIVMVPSPYPHIQTARDVVIPRAFTAGFGVYDPQNGLLLDPRTALDGVTIGSIGSYPTIAPGLIDHAASALDVEEFLIVETADNTYAQTRRDAADSYTVEYRDGSPDRHFGSQVQTAEQVRAFLTAWATGDVAAYEHLDWQLLTF